MTEEELNKFFVNFNNISNQFEDGIALSNLSLSVSKKIVEQMGGDIKVESTVGTGTTFCLEFSTRAQTKRHGISILDNS